MRPSPVMMRGARGNAVHAESGMNFTHLPRTTLAASPSLIWGACPSVLADDSTVKQWMHEAVPRARCRACGCGESHCSGGARLSMEWLWAFQGHGVGRTLIGTSWIGGSERGRAQQRVCPRIKQCLPCELGGAGSGCSSAVFT